MHPIRAAFILYVFLHLGRCNATIAKLPRKLGFIQDEPVTVLCLGSVNIKYVSDDALDSKVRAITPLTTMKDDQALLLSLHMKYGLVNLLRHANHMLPYLQSFHHIQISTLENKNTLQCDQGDEFIHHFHPQWPSLRKVSIFIHSQDHTWGYQCISIMRMFANTFLPHCELHIASSLLFHCGKAQGRLIYNNLIQLDHLLLPEMEELIIHVDTSDEIDLQSIDYRNFRWIHILLDKLDTNVLQFKFPKSGRMITSIQTNIIAQMRKIWRNITTHTTQHLPYGLIFEKNTKGHIRTDDHIYIPASTFWQKHEQERKNKL